MAAGDFTLLQSIGFALTGRATVTDDREHKHKVTTQGSAYTYEEYDENDNLITSGVTGSGGQGWDAWDGKEGKWDSRSQKGGRKH